MRKLCAMFIIFALTLTTVVSCGKKTERVENVFRAEEIKLPEGFSPEGLAFYDGGYAVSAADDNGSKLFRFDGSGLVSETPLESYGDNIAAFPDGRVVSAGGDFIEIVSPDGTLETAKLEGLTGGVIDIACADGMMIIASQTSAIVADDKGALLFALPVDVVWSVGQVGGRLVIQGLDRDVMRVNCRYVDPEKEELGEVLDVSGDLLDSPLGLFTKRTTGIYDAEGIVCDFLNSDLLGNRLAAIAVLDRDSMLAAVANDNGRTLYRLTRVPENEIVPKKLIRAAGSDISESFLEDAIKFNLEDAEYRIVVDDYSVYNTSDNELAGVEKLKNDIISGYRPDIMLLSSFSPNHTYNNEYRNKNLFADLYEFESDPDFDLDDIPGGILRAGETNGKLLELPLEITSDVLAVKCDLDRWTLREYLDWAKTHEPVLNSITRGDPVATLYFMLTCSMEEFIDADGNVKFDSELFRDALEYALECEDIEVSNEAVNTNVNATALCAKKVSLGDDVRFIGYPDSDGNGVRIFMK